MELIRVAREQGGNAEAKWRSVFSLIRFSSNRARILNDIRGRKRRDEEFCREAGVEFFSGRAPDGNVCR